MKVDNFETTAKNVLKFIPIRLVIVRAFLIFLYTYLTFRSIIYIKHQFFKWNTLLI